MFGQAKRIAKYSRVKCPEDAKVPRKTLSKIEVTNLEEPKITEARKVGPKVAEAKVAEPKKVVRKLVKRKKVLPKVITIKVRGNVTEPKTWAARYFTKFVVESAPDRYEADVEFLFEAEWIYMRRQLFSEGIGVPGIGEPMCAVWINDEYIGDDIALGKFLRKDGYIADSVLMTLFNVNVQISKDPLDYCPRFLERSYAYFNVEVNGRNIGRMVFEIFNDLMPESCDRFLKECTRYNDCRVHRIAHDGWFESGQLEKQAPPMREKRKTGMTNCREGMLSLINYGRTNCKTSQFLITTVPATFLDPYQCPISALIDGVAVLEKINNIETHYDSPLKDVILKNVTILYAPHYVVQRNHLITTKAVAIRPNVWREQDEMRMKKIKSDLKWAPRIEKTPKYHQITDELEIQLNDIRLQLYKENRVLREIIDEPRFKHIVESVIEKEEIGGKRIDFSEEEMKKVECVEKWYKILMNADSEFELYYQPAQVPEICDEWKDEVLRKLSIIDNPTVLGLLQNVRKRELAIVLDIIKRLLDEVVNEAVHTTQTKQLYIEPIFMSQQEFSRPLGEEIERLPQSMQDILINEVCDLSDTAFNLFRITMKQMLQNLSQAELHEVPTLSGDLFHIITATKSFLSVQSLSAIEIERRKESLKEDIHLLAESMMSVHRRLKKGKCFK